MLLFNVRISVSWVSFLWNRNEMINIMINGIILVSGWGSVLFCILGLFVLVLNILLLLMVFLIILVSY